LPQALAPVAAILALAMSVPAAESAGDRQIRQIKGR
jgi:hypothetical protein